MKFRTLANSACGPSGTEIEIEPGAELPIGLSEGQLGPLQLHPLDIEASAALANFLDRRGLAPHARPRAHGNG
jgi:hypothetical protein